MAQFDRLPERDYWIAEYERKRLECPCGRPVAECSDPNRKWYPFRTICYATMEREAAAAALADLRGDTANYHDGTFADWAPKRSDEHPYPAGAGESIGVADRDLAPHDHFTTDLEASPIPPSDDDEG